MLFPIYEYFCLKLVQYDEYLVSTADHQAIRGHSAEYATMCFQVFMG